MATKPVAPKTYEAPLAIAPGVTVAEMLKDAGMTQKELAIRMGRPAQAVNEIIRGKKAITAETASQLEAVLELPQSYWLKREQNFQAAKQRIAEQARLEQEKAEIAKDAERLAEFPYNELAKRGYVKSTRGRAERVVELRRFLRVANFTAVDNYINSFRMAARLAKTSELTFAKLAVWLRIAELEAAAEGWHPESFNSSMLERQLPILRQLSREPMDEVARILRRIGEEAGVVFLFVREFKGFPTKGINAWIGNRPYVLLTLHGKRHDMLWFSLFHEIGHLLLHDRQLIVEGEGLVQDERLELEADTFARDKLISPDDYARLRKLPLTPQTIRSFADSIQIDPGIVVGRLMHEGLIRYDNVRFRKLLRPADWMK
ncbi:ImmA/IrrE family metallo-endopeptidase [bacterium]|nr:ImmA/IrrE family metallo-endopeptidase [bacterium]